MNTYRTFSLAVLAAIAVGAPACGKQAVPDATQPLQQSFQTAAPEVQQVIARVNTQLKAGQVAEATRTLAPVVTGRPLNDAQRQAVGVALQQINKAVAANHSMKSGKSVRIADLATDIGVPDYPAMPSHSDPVPMPPRGRGEA